MLLKDPENKQALLSFLYSQAVYPIQYPWKTVIMISIFGFIFYAFATLQKGVANQYLSNSIITVIYLAFVTFILFRSSDQRQKLYLVLRNIKSSLSGGKKINLNRKKDTV